jgi:hypothetical protein
MISFGGLAVGTVAIVVCDRMNWQTEHLRTFYAVARATQFHVSAKICRGY